MAGCERCGGCRRRRARAFRLLLARKTSASCTKSSLDPPNRKRPGDPPHRGAFVYWQAQLRAARKSRLLADNDDDEGARLHLSAALAGSRRIEVGGGKKDVVSLEVETHSAGGLLREDIFDDGELVRGILVDDGKIAIVTGGEHVTRRRFEGAGIRAIADGRRGDDLAGIGVHDGHYFFVADGKEAASGNVHGEAGRRFARRERPVVEFLEALRIEMMELGGILVVDIESALAVSDGEFGFAIQGDSADYGAIRGVDRGGVFAAAVEGEDALADEIIKDGIGVSVGLDRANGLESLEVEDSDGVGAAVAGEAAAEAGSKSDAMDALGVGDVADDGVGVRIENHYVRAARDVDAASVTVHVDVIPAALATERDGLDDVIAGTSGSRCGRARDCYGRKDDRHCE